MIRYPLSIYFAFLPAVFAAAPRFARAAAAATTATTIATPRDSSTAESDPEPVYPDYAQNDPLEKAAIQFDAGQYRRVLQTLATAPAGSQKLLLTAQAQLILGRYSDAEATLNSPALHHSADAQTLLARVLLARGKVEDAVAMLRKITADYPQSIVAHFYLGQACEAAGDLIAAQQAYGWFVQPSQDFLTRWQGHPENFNDPAEAILIARAIDRWATLTAAYARQPDLHQTVLNFLIDIYDRIDRGNEPAHVAAAEFFVRHDDPGQAETELKQALAANPHDPAAWLLAGRMALDQYNFDAADAAIAQLRKVNPHDSFADELAARNFLLQRQPQLAQPILQSLLAQQPHNFAALGLLAGADELLLEETDAEKVLASAQAISSQSATPSLEVADQLGGMRQYARAETFYKKAIQLEPNSATARNGLGLLYAQSGQEDLARVALNAAHAIDPFNVETTNYLRLLDRLATFTRAESEHFIVFYDAKIDPVIPEYFGEYLESVYPQVCGNFDWQPGPKTLIEVFPTHDEFSVRTAGTPWIATVGASTGRVIALVAPRTGERTMGPFNWSRVLRHEFTHTVTLAATDNRIAHWFTEGLAVQEEHAPLPWEWAPMLYDAVQNHHLFDLDQLTWAFVRPKKPTDRALAYAESSWICLYIEEKFGHAATLRMLKEFRDGHTQADVFQLTFHESQNEFFIGFQAWCQQRISTWGYDAASSAKYDQLRSAGEAAIAAHEYPQAVDFFEQIAKLRPVDLLPHERLAGLYLRLHETQPAVEQLDALAAVEQNNNRYSKAAARLLRDAGNFPAARERALRAVYLNPYDAAAHQLLADLDEKTHDETGRARELRVLAELQSLQSADSDFSH